MKEIVKYNNEMNKIALSGFNEKELNILFSLIVLAKDKGTSELNIPFSELKTLSNDDGKNRKRFINSMVNVNSKIIKLFYKIETDDAITMFTLFNKFKLDLKNDTLLVQINEDFSFLLNDLVGKFTKFELIDFVKLKSSYSKNMFKLLKQWESKKEKEFSLDELRDLLCVPTSYNNSKFNEKVLKPILTELPEFFPNFKMDKKRNGKKIIGYSFTWGKKYQDINYVEDLEIEISHELQKAFEKASHNRFIQPFLTQDNKAELVEFFEDEKILIKGLLYAYKKIDKEFKRLSYLIKTIKTGAEQQTKTIKVVKKDKTDITIEDIQNDNIRQTSFDEISPKENQSTKTTIYEDEYEEKYAEYLKNNNAEDNFFMKQTFNMSVNILPREKKTSNQLGHSNIDTTKNIYKKSEEKKIYTIEDIPEEKLIGKNGKKLVGGALKMRAKKILDEMNK